MMNRNSHAARMIAASSTCSLFVITSARHRLARRAAWDVSSGVVPDTFEG